MKCRCEECGEEFESLSVFKPRKICYKNECKYKRRIRLYGNPADKNDYCKGIHKKESNIVYKRNCLRCEKKFKTKNKFQRICGNCHRNIDNRNYVCGWEYGEVVW
jgi:hypothetical protein